MFTTQSRASRYWEDFKHASVCPLQRDGSKDTEPEYEMPGLRSRNLLLLKFTNQMVATTFALPASALLSAARGDARTSRARQTAMYLMNTVLSWNFNDIGTVYQRDRTTVSHACRIVEELRDNPNFDHRMQELENTIAIVLEFSQTGRDAARDAQVG